MHTGTCNREIIYLLPAATTRLLNPSRTRSLSHPQSPALCPPVLPRSLSPALPHFPLSGCPLRLSSGNAVDDVASSAAKKVQALQIIGSSSRRESLARTLTFAAGRGIVNRTPSNPTMKGIAHELRAWAHAGAIVWASKCPF